MLGRLTPLRGFRRPPLTTPGEYLVPLDPLDDAFEQAVVDQNPVAGIDFLVQAAMVDGHLLDAVVHAADQIVGAQHQRLAGTHFEKFSVQLAKTDLGALQILKDGDMPIQFLRRFPHPPNGQFVIFQGAVREVQPDHIRAFPQQSLDRLRIAGTRPQRRHNLGEFHDLRHIRRAPR